MENGSVAGRALHFAAAGGSSDVASFLLAKNCLPAIRTAENLACC